MCIRDSNYNVKLSLTSIKTDNRVVAASANCYVMKHNAFIMFDPYTRTETGGEAELHVVVMIPLHVKVVHGVHADVYKRQDGVRLQKR